MYMKKRFLLTIFLLTKFSFIFCHDGHSHNDLGHAINWQLLLGSFHFIFLHFPIALIYMTGVAEILSLFKKKNNFDTTARFMLISAAVLVIPTIFTGLLYRWDVAYEGKLVSYIFWHMWMGVFTAIFTIIVAMMRQFFGKTKWYYYSLIFLIISISVTAFLGGSITHGTYHFLLKN